MSHTNPSRVRICLNRAWQFHRGECGGAHLPAHDDASWQTVGVPHTFDLPYFRTPEFYVGVGWYRRRFDVPADWAGGRLFLEFDGAFQVATVHVNGIEVGAHEGGYTGFSIDVTAAVHPGENVLAVRVDNIWNPRIAPRAGEHLFSGGLYRDVHLLVVDPLHIPWCGTGVTTPAVSPEAATVEVRTELRNDRDAPARCDIAVEIIDAAGRSVATAEAVAKTLWAHTSSVAVSTASVDHPLLWHPDHPNLYSARTTVSVDGVAVDRTDTPFGIRRFEWTADRGFFLNGEHLYLRGANVHQDHAGWGIGITRGSIERDVRLIKEAGFNFVRGAHYPHQPAFAEACDRLGVVFWSEGVFWGKGGFGPEGYWNASAFPVEEADRGPFGDSCKRALAEMIRTHRNHPSIVVWSMTNEAFFTYDLPLARGLMAELVQVSRELDPTRPAAIGGAQRGDVDRIGDVAGYNGDGARLFIDPGVPNMVSEYGAIGKPHDAFAPFFGELQPERFAWRSGEAIWCGFDYGTIAGRQGLKGILHHNRLPKRSWHWYRKELLGLEPPPEATDDAPVALHLDVDRSVIRGTDGLEDVQVTTTVLGAAGTPVRACPPITLSIESGPGELPTGRSITFAADTDIPVVCGQAAIAFRSYHGGETTLRATSPGLTDATIVITTLGEPAFIAGREVADRPYVPPEPSAAAIAATQRVVNVARNRPIKCSSGMADHPARHANDAAAATFWQSAEPGAGAWLCVDLEGYYQLSGWRIVFPATGNYRYQVETSVDLAAWTMAIDRTGSVRVDPVRNDVFDPGTVARYVRVTLTAVPADGPTGIAEVEVHGILQTR